VTVKLISEILKENFPLKIKELRKIPSMANKGKTKVSKMRKNEEK
jgi:hypothetical protein